MKKLLYLCWFLGCYSIQAQFVNFSDSTSKNRFLGLDMSMCKISSTGSARNYQKAYDCGNDSISQLLNVNFLSPANFGQQFYIYNNFMYWMGKNLQSGNKYALSNDDPEHNFSGSGVFMIILGTSPYLKQIIGADQSCPQGQSLVMAQLKYNDGSSIATWSQHAICCAPDDDFSLEISSDEDTTVPVGSPTDDIDGQGVDWMKDSGPSPVYKQATTSPRKVRLVKKAGNATTKTATKKQDQKPAKKQDNLQKMKSSSQK